jgi:Fungal chitosanase of glycosyl hydrolase group 75
MNEGERPRNSRKRRFKGFGLRDLIYLAVIGMALLALVFSTKIKSFLRPKSAVKPLVAKIDEKELARLAARRLETEQKYLTEIAELKQSLEEAKKRGAAKAAAIPEGRALDADALMDVRKLQAGIPFKTELKLDKGRVASIEREDQASYTASYELKVRLPAAAKNLAELQQINPNLAKILPGLSAMLEKGELSSWYPKIYEEKTIRLRKDATVLNELLTKHNLYDCETILNLRGPSGQKLFFLQADMDVVSDGSDGDRLAVMPQEIVDSPNYQPFTSYGWPKKTPTPNPMIAGVEKRCHAAEREMNASATTAARKATLRERIKSLKRNAEDLKSRSFLIADYDPFIVIPINVLGSHDEFAPNIGDYAVVIFGDKVYPTIVGDGGPAFKVGEASLRLAKELNVKASSYRRPVSDLQVSYIVFPGSRDSERGPPNYDRWRQRCFELLNEAGGLGAGYSLHLWSNTLPLALPPTLPTVPPLVPGNLPGGVTVTPQPSSGASVPAGVNE